MTRLLLTCALLLSLAGPSAAACPPVQRSAAVVRAFRKAHPCPSTGLTTGPCRTHIADHAWPLCALGPDSVENVRWMEVEAAKAKDTLERQACRKLCACQSNHATGMPK
jgi:hypothetical protein